VYFGRGVTPGANAVNPRRAQNSQIRGSTFARLNLIEKMFFERGAVPGATFKKNKKKPLRLFAQPLSVLNQ
jgi:hypothetical protein